MRKLLAAFAVLLFCACSHVPQTPVSTCPIKVAGLDASYTIQPAVMSPTLIGGAPANPTEWPASIYIESEGAACSSTLIGPRVAITAGHCVKDDGTMRFSVGSNKYTARCNHHPEYQPKKKAGNETADISMCLVNRPVIGVDFERVATKENFKVGEEIRLTGYGCIRTPGVGGNDGIFRIGLAKVMALPHAKNYNLISKGSAAICFGDSGGAAFKEFGDGNRQLQGINSQGDIATTSWLSDLSTSSIQSFMKTWSKSHGVKICGIDPDAEACRTIGAGPSSDPTFAYKNAAGCLNVEVTPGYMGKKAQMFDALKKTMDSF